MSQYDYVFQRRDELNKELNLLIDNFRKLPLVDMVKISNKNGKLYVSPQFDRGAVLYDDTIPLS
jgi:hypothetical protein